LCRILQALFAKLLNENNGKLGRKQEITVVRKAHSFSDYLQLGKSELAYCTAVSAAAEALYCYVNYYVLSLCA